MRSISLAAAVSGVTVQNQPAVSFLTNHYAVPAGSGRGETPFLPGREAIAAITLTGVTGTPNYKIQGSDDNTNWTDLLVNTGLGPVSGNVTIRPYMRFAVIGGGGAGTVSATLTAESDAMNQNQSKNKLKLVMILIDVNVMTKVPKLVAPYDIPLYRAVYGDEKVEITATQYAEADELPDAREEYQRLRNQFGVDEETKQPFVSICYGNGVDGIDRLEKAIKATGSKADPEPAQKVVDGDTKIDKEKAEVRAKGYARDPVTGDPVKNIDDLPAAKDPLEGSGLTPQAQSAIGFAGSNAETDARQAKITADRAKGIADFERAYAQQLPANPKGKPTQLPADPDAKPKKLKLGPDGKPVMKKKARVAK